MATHRWGAEAPSISRSFQMIKDEENMHEKIDMVAFFPANSLGAVLSSYVHTRQLAQAGTEL